ncbi:MAG: hypothetical protein NT094_01010 [Candidatus Staskawiczbacteria bacterium]|nr:hypothetical protein [Candidatus Staskawiczbacteria bacterium]
MKKYIIILVIVIIVIVLVGGYFGYQSYLSTKTSIKDQAVGWKVYTNKDYGFEMKQQKNKNIKIFQL